MQTLHQKQTIKNPEENQWNNIFKLLMEGEI